MVLWRPGPLSLIAGIVLLMVFFVRRKDWFSTRYAQDDAGDSIFDVLYTRMSGDNARKLTTYEGAFASVTTAISFLFLAFFSLSCLFAASVDAAGWIGAPAILFFAIGMIVPGLSLLIWHSRPARIPLFTLVFCLLMVASLFNDGHTIDVSPGIKPDRPSLDEALERWEAAHKSDDPIFIVAAPGGASRAAYWTGTVLAALDQKTRGRFTQNVFAISSVSGGSLGAYDYAAWLSAVPERCRGGEEGTKFVQRVIGADYLSPVVAGMFHPNLAQLFIPFPVLPSRGKFLEEGFRQGWQHEPERVNEKLDIACQPLVDPLRLDFTTPWTSPRKDAGWVPLVFANSTHVETGRRVIFSPVRAARKVPGDAFFRTFLNAYDFTSDFADGHGIDAASAIHNSARFPIVSPAGRLPAGHGCKPTGHLVDGGYFDSSGLVTAYELARYLAAKFNADPSRARPIFIIDIDNVDKVDPADLERYYGPVTNDGGATAASDTTIPRWGPLLYEVSLIGEGFIGTWSARQHYEAKRISEATNAADSKAGAASIRYLRLGLPLPGADARNREPVALNWALSPSMRERMDKLGKALVDDKASDRKIDVYRILNCTKGACPAERIFEAVIASKEDKSLMPNRR